MNEGHTDVGVKVGSADKMNDIPLHSPPKVEERYSLHPTSFNDGNFECHEPRQDRRPGVNQNTDRNFKFRTPTVS